MARIIMTIIVGKYRLPYAVFAYVDRIEDEFEAARALASRLYPADQGYAHLYPGDPRLWMSAIRLLVPRD
jgi:hypothetical protein